MSHPLQEAPATAAAAAADAIAETMAAAPAAPTDMQLSKKQQKKLERSNYLREKKQLQNEEKKRKKAAMWTETEEEKEAGEPATKAARTDSNNGGEGEGLPPLVPRAERKRQLDAEFTKKCDSHFKVVIDCSWEEEHNLSSLKSLVQQVMYSYGFNKKHEHPVHLYITGVGALMKAQLEKLLYQNWLCVHVQEEDFINEQGQFTPQLIAQQQQPQQQQGAGVEEEASSSSSSSSAASAAANAAAAPQAQAQATSAVMTKEDVVYLSSDATETLESFDANTVYVIGGIVDRNRLKGITHRKAEKLNICTAKLPIKENFDFSATHVLTVNHVFEIMLRYAVSQDWKQAIEAVLPKRKELQEKEERKAEKTKERKGKASAAAAVEFKTSQSNSGSSSSNEVGEKAGESITAAAAAAIDGGDNDDDDL
jgi:tRNA (guanine9-N1)-methyltransferase